MLRHVSKGIRRIGAVVLVGLLLVGVFCPSGSAAQPPARSTERETTSRATWAARAFTSYAALQRHLYLGADQHQLYLEKYPRDPADNAYSFLWPMREATAATIDVSLVPSAGRGFRSDVRDRFAGLSAYLNPDHAPPGYASYVVPPLGGGGDLFYDDNAIVGLEFVRRYLLEHRVADRRRAEQVFDVLTRGWDTDTSHACPGGMFWVDATWTSIRAANVTGLTAELAAHLYELTRDKSYLDWAKRLYDWNRSCLRSSEGLYQNDISLDGTVNPTLWIYNSGAMIGAGVLLHRATGDARYLTQARADADAALAYWTEGNRYFDQPAVFNAIFFKNLMLLDSARHDARYRAVVEEYAEHTWQHNRDPALGLFRFPPSGGGPYDPSYRPETLEQAAVVQTFALLAWDRDRYRFAA